MSHAGWHLSFRLSAIVAVCGYLLGCGSASSDPSSDAPVTAVASTKNPLVASYSVSSQTGGRARVEFGTDISYGRQTAWYSVPPGGRVLAILVAGMRASTTYHMRAELVSSASDWFDQDRVFVTGPLPSMTFPSLVVTRPGTSALAATENPGVELINLTEPAVHMMQAVVADHNGNPIWYYDVGADQENLPIPIKLMPSGHLIVNIQGGRTGTTRLREIDLAGRTLRQIDARLLQQKLRDAGHPVSGLFFHHDVLPLSNGHLIVLGNVAQDFNDLPGYPGTTQVTGDVLVDLDQDWNPVWFWSTF